MPSPIGTPPSPWGREIKARRSQLRLTQTDLAERLDVRQATISQWETGVVTPSARMQAELVRTLGIDPMTLHGLLLGTKDAA